MPDQTASFKPTLGLFDSTMIVAGSMIGSGIFIVSANITRYLYFTCFGILCFSYYYETIVCRYRVGHCAAGYSCLLSFHSKPKKD